MISQKDEARVPRAKRRWGEANASAVEPGPFETIFHEHWPRVYAVLFRLVGDPAEAEDLALETFWRLYRRPPEDGRELKLAGWLYRVATNLGFNALRAWKRRQRYEGQAGQWELEERTSPDPDESFAEAEERRRVREVLADMNPRQAQLLLLRHSGLSYRELADALDVSPGSIGTLLARAEKEFQKRYGPFRE